MSGLPRCERISIVLIDDEAGFRTSLSEMLRDDGHDVIEYGNASDVPALVSLSGDTLLVTAYDMKGHNGLDVAERFRRAHPAVPALVLTGYDANAFESVTKGRPSVWVVRRPLAYDHLHATIHEVVANASL